MKKRELLIYRETENRELLDDMIWLMEHCGGGEADRSLQTAGEREKNRSLLYSCMHRLLEMVGHYGFYGNLWHCYLPGL